MQKLKNSLILGGALMLLATVGTVLNHGFNPVALEAKDKDGGPTVTIGGPLPLPTTAVQNGSWNVGVTGTVAATQSGPWNVGINGTPSVNIANMPTFNFPATVLAYDQTVTVPQNGFVNNLPPVDVSGFKSIRVTGFITSGDVGATVLSYLDVPGGAIQFDSFMGTKVYTDILDKTFFLAVKGGSSGSSTVDLSVFGRAN